MEKIDAFSLVAGIVLLLGGLVLLVISIFVWFLIFYAVALLVIGLVILFTLRKQEYVEPIKKERIKKRGK